MISFTLDTTRAIAEKLIEIDAINKVYLQTLKVVDGEKTAIVIPDGTEYKEIGFQDNKGMVAYFRDLGEIDLEDAQIDSIGDEYYANMPVRLVVFSEDFDKNTATLSRAILDKLTGCGQIVQKVYFNAVDILDLELPGSKIPLSPRSFVFAVDMNIRELLQLEDCINVIDCDSDSLIVTS